MGDFAKRISDRQFHTKIWKGYCLICGEYGLMSEDHVPPKGAITLTRIEQHHIGELTRAGASKVKGVKSPGGSFFKTICATCNNKRLGENDTEVAKVCSSVTAKVKDYFERANYPTTMIRTEVNAISFARAMIGHILAATSVDECKNPPESFPYIQALKDFVLGDDSALNETHEIFYWFYPYSKHLSAKFVTFYNQGHTAHLSLLSFFPIAFMVTEKDRAIYPSHANTLSMQDKFMYFDLSSRGFEYSEFPFHGLKDNQIMLLKDCQAIVSTPIPKK